MTQSLKSRRRRCAVKNAFDTGAVYEFYQLSQKGVGNGT